MAIIFGFAGQSEGAPALHREDDPDVKVLHTNSIGRETPLQSNDTLAIRQHYRLCPQGAPDPTRRLNDCRAAFQT
ncbi:hypothetical protein EYF80_058906 [Liparis tanakae]|uniref:Uncharacterized protein n=1 Tax=Liparis tanakae TaxID=230148 RepID=A0A4Z2ERM6_9TELE|nr:hypothetical protein EYF80_058906 [Liparis tanakae]